MLVKKLMIQNPIVIDKDQSVSFAIDLMRKNRISRLPVLDKGVLVGIITERDIVAKLSSGRATGLSSSSIRVSSIMTSNPMTISQEADVTEAAKEMVAHNVSSLPVITKEDRFVGIITKTRMLKLCLKVDNIYVGQVMTKNPTTTSPNTRLVNVGRLLLEKNLNLLPVIDGGKLVGLITDGLIALAMFNIVDKTDGKHVDRQIRQGTVSSAMRSTPPFCKPDSKIKDAAKLMIEERLKGLPVLDYNNRLVGVITKTNLTQLVSNRLEV